MSYGLGALGHKPERSVGQARPRRRLSLVAGLVATQSPKLKALDRLCTSIQLRLQASAPGMRESELKAVSLGDELNGNVFLSTGDALGPLPNRSSSAPIDQDRRRRIRNRFGG